MGSANSFVYAACHWLEHYKEIESISLFGLASVESICEAGSIRLHNWIEQNRRPGCAVKPTFKFDSSLYNPLSTKSIHALKVVLVHLLERADFAQKKCIPNTAVAAAAQIQQWGEPARLQRF